MEWLGCIAIVDYLQDQILTLAVDDGRECQIISRRISFYRRAQKSVAGVHAEHLLNVIVDRGKDLRIRKVNKIRVPARMPIL
jgi:hypothetical protein